MAVHIGVIMSGNGDQNGKQLALILVAIVIIGGGFVWFLFSGPSESENKTYANITLIGREGSEVILDFSELKDMDSMSGDMRYENRLGNWGESSTFEGVKISELVEKVGGMEPGDILTISSTDGYFQEYNYYNVYPSPYWESLQGDFILAFSLDGEDIPGWEKGPRTVFLPEDGDLSNIDVRYTSGAGHGYFVNPSAGSRLVRDTWKFEITRERSPETEWTMTLNGSRSMDLSRSEFESLSYGNLTNITRASGTSWSGLEISRILGLVDGGPKIGDSTFNLSYAQSGYEVRVSGANSTSLDSRALSESQMIIAQMADGDSLAAPALVGEGILVEDVDSIEFYTLWKLKVEGEKTKQLFLSDIIRMENIEGSAGFKKVTGTVRGPYEVVGAPIEPLIEMTGDLPANYSVEVIASDGYSMMLSHEEIEGQVITYDSQGTETGMGGVDGVLIYEMDGSSDFSGGPLRLGYVGDSGQITDGHYWVKEVAEIVVNQPVKDWDVELSGSVNAVLNRSSFISGATCGTHRTSVEVTMHDETHMYSGFPLWVVLSIVDGKMDPEGHYLFDDDLAAGGYGVEVIAGDGYSRTLNSTLVARNDDIILAYKKDGEVLPEDEGPLRVVGSDLSSKYMVSNLVKIIYHVPGQ